MESIDRTTSKAQVTKALKNVADFNGDIESFTFSYFHDYHKNVFLRSLKNYINQLICSDDLGNQLDTEYFDLDLTESLISGWSNMAVCIDYIVENHYRVVGNRKKLNL
ncbi:MAG TPA: hypothetical protein PKL31_12330 [Fulvivirga sp.]|nr:hypothetical protein [Fulvivirga sp.]